MRREDLASLALFLTVAEERSFTRAAVRLGLSQSALSHAMRRLETKLGLRLLTRTTRSVAPTEAGERLIETLRPALDAIDGRIAALTELREKPAGTVRITTPEQPARTILWPAIDRLTAAYPDICVELDLDASLTDIVAGRFDAGVRLGERLEQDMIAVPIGPRLRMATVAAPDYLARRGVPATPHDLADHACINRRMPNGSLYVWEYEKDGRVLNVKVEGQIVVNDVDLILAAARAGHGLAHVVEDRVQTLVADGTLVRLFAEWCPPFDGYFLYYPSRRQPSAAFALVLEALRYRDPFA
ncbi:LysR family transcriptional regulator [Sphingomonas sp. CD22]|uniref:LysR family transcriptional regulator n=1 Tax=Sphingomonas sp. CD22 TaxID=3100214 RepID=UPI002AE02BA8|nr:LysR family transcriptional regulator [Sphingomonas sp. CD22]MEA1086204.1 LysR family transcriptional regulator [Sphingomonas sp. CD22]